MRSHDIALTSQSGAGIARASTRARATRSEKAGSSEATGSSTPAIRGGSTQTIGAPGTWLAYQGRRPGRSLTTSLQPQASASPTTSGSPS